MEVKKYHVWFRDGHDDIYPGNYLQHTTFGYTDFFDIVLDNNIVTMVAVDVVHHIDVERGHK